MNTNNPENFWIPHLKENGIHLLVEIQLSFDQFRKLLSDSIGSIQSDQQVFQFWEIANRRLLPTDQNSFSGIGYDIGQILKSALSEPTTKAQTCSTDCAELIEESKKYLPCMSLSVSDEGKAVELILDTSVSTYAEWIPGEGGDVCLLRCQETKRVVGCVLPLMNRKLVVQHNGPIRINDGFRLTDCP